MKCKLVSSGYFAPELIKVVKIYMGCGWLPEDCRYLFLE